MFGEPVIACPVTSERHSLLYTDLFELPDLD